MSYQTTTAYQKLSTLKKRIRIVQGGTSAGKTIAIVLYLIDLANKYDNLSISIVAESTPHLKRGAMRDFLNIMREQDYYVESGWAKADKVYTFENGSYIEFFSADSADKMRGSRRDVLFINECNNVAYLAYEQLEVRTRRMIILDYNPVQEFWVHTEVMPSTDNDFIILTYKDNESLEQSIITSIESRKHNENWWRVYGMGLVGSLEGQIYPEWAEIEEIPPEARLERYGIDFGFTNDPTAIVAVYRYNEGFIIDEIAYGTGMHNIDIANALRRHENLEPAIAQNSYTGRTTTLAIADSAEPKSIDDIKRHGVSITGSTKGTDSVRFGIDVVQNQKITLTKRSTNIRKEQRNYLWKLDKNGKSLNVPEHEFSHSMDAIRYVINELVAKPKIRVFTNKPSGF